MTNPDTPQHAATRRLGIIAIVVGAVFLAQGVYSLAFRIGFPLLMRSSQVQTTISFWQLDWSKGALTSMPGVANYFNIMTLFGIVAGVIGAIILYGGLRYRRAPRATAPLLTGTLWVFAAWWVAYAVGFSYAWSMSLGGRFAATMPQAMHSFMAYGGTAFAIIFSGAAVVLTVVFIRAVRRNSHDLTAD